MNIKTLRQIIKLSQADFAEYIGIPVANIRNWEQGFRNPPDYVINLIERIMINDGYIFDTSKSFQSCDNHVPFEVRVNDKMEYTITFEYERKMYEIDAPRYYAYRMKPNIYAYACGFVVDDKVDELRFDSLCGE